ncbi:MAG: tetratricopeptide repeat protein, partial [Polyangiaceae bacterium]|nr:tetratricopeptide repeat protein [Polyangiaceae bacterium]
AVLMLTRRGDSAHVEQSTGAGPMVVALGFALHPMLSQTVLWTEGRIDLVVSLLAVALVALHRRDGAVARLCSAACLGFALGITEVALCLPFLLLAFDLTHRGRTFRKWIWFHAINLAVVVVYLAVRPKPSLGVGTGFMDWVYGYTANLISIAPRIVVPFETTALRPHAPPSLRAVGVVAFVVIAATIAVGVFVDRASRFGETKAGGHGSTELSRRSSAVAWGWLWFLVAMVPYATAGPLNGAVGDNIVCLAAIGLAIMAVPIVEMCVESLMTGLRRIVPSGMAIGMLAVVLGGWWLGLAWQSASRGQDFRDESAIMDAELRINSGNHVAHRAMGSMLAARGDFDSAHSSIVRSLAIAPSDWRSWKVLCFAEKNREQFDKAVASCRRSLRENESDMDTRLLLAEALIGLNQWSEAAAEATKVLAARPNHQQAKAIVDRALQLTR